MFVGNNNFVKNTKRYIFAYGNSVYDQSMSRKKKFLCKQNLNIFITNKAEILTGI